MNVLIQFDDQNRDLAAAIGAALLEYGKTEIRYEGHVSLPDAPLPEEPEPETEIPTMHGSPVVEPEFEPEPQPDQQLITDEHGVPHNPQFCGPAKADKPFYASGKQAGQWKRKRGVSEDDYNEWYAKELPPIEGSELEPRPANTAAAFGAPEPTAETEPEFANPGEFMHWCAEQTAAGHLTQEQITQAYVNLGITAADMFGDDPDKIAGYVQQLHQALSQ